MAYDTKSTRNFGRQAHFCSLQLGQVKQKKRDVRVRPRTLTPSFLGHVFSSLGSVPIIHASLLGSTPRGMSPRFSLREPTERRVKIESELVSGWWLTPIDTKFKGGPDCVFTKPSLSSPHLFTFVLCSTRAAELHVCADRRRTDYRTIAGRPQRKIAATRVTRSAVHAGIYREKIVPPRGRRFGRAAHHISGRTGREGINPRIGSGERDGAVRRKGVEGDAPQLFLRQLQSVQGSARRRLVHRQGRRRTIDRGRLPQRPRLSSSPTSWNVCSIRSPTRRARRPRGPRSSPGMPKWTTRIRISTRTSATRIPTPNSSRSMCATPSS